MMTLDEAARIVEAEASVLGWRGKLAVAQCIADNDYNAAAFTAPAESYGEESMRAVQAVALHGARRFTDCKLLQFRSFKKYGDQAGQPDWNKLSNVPSDLLYLGEDHASAEWGHFYFGRGNIMKNFKMLLIAGHGRNVDGTTDPGACGNGYRESDLTRELAAMVKYAADRAGIACDVAPDRNTYSYLKAGGTMDFTPYNYVLEIHFNASAVTDPTGDGRMRGSMFYISASEKGHGVEDAILANLYALGGVQAWDGVVAAQRQWAGGLLVQETARAQGVSHGLLETCFVSDFDDVSWYEVNKSRIAQGIVAGIRKGFKLERKGFEPYTVKVIDPALNIRAGAGTDTAIVGQITDQGTYTIVGEADGIGAEKWGKLLSGAGWVSLDFCRKNA